MKLITRFLTMVSAIIIIAFSTSCVPRSVVASGSTSEPPIIITAAPTASPTATPSPTPTETPVVISVSDQQKQDFINKTGEYTYENIEKELYITGSLLERLNKTYDLGVVQYIPEDFGFVVVQGWLLGYREENGDLILEVGFDSKNEEKRIIENVIVPVAFYKQQNSDGIGLTFWDRELWQKVDSGSVMLGIKRDIKSIEDLFEPFINKPMKFSFYSTPVKNIPGSEKYGDVVRNLENLFTENISAVNCLLTEICGNDEDIDIGSIERAGSSSLILVVVEACYR